MPIARIALIVGVLTHASVAAQGSPGAKELAAYRLTTPVFKQFDKASRLIAEVTRRDPALASSPLFTKEITLSGDAPVMAAELETRLKNHPALARALHSARMSAREYARFALALIAARLAHGFVKSGLLRSVPAGVAADNVAFVEAHHDEIAAVLKKLAVEN